MSAQDTLHGFTLVETLVVIGISVVLFGVGVTSYRGYAQRQELENEAKNIISQIRTAQNMALAGHGQELCSGVEYTGVRYAYSITDETYKYQVMCGLNLIDISSEFQPMLSNADKFSFNPTPGSEVTFYALGKGTSAPSFGGRSIVVSRENNPHNFARIVVTKGGSITYIIEGT